MGKIILKLLKKIYSLICFFYRNIFTYLQDTFIKKSYVSSYKKNNLYFTFTNKDKSFIKQINKFSDSLKYEYNSIYIFDENDLLELLKKIFNKDTKNLITLKTGFNYSIDFFSFYENFHIPKKFSKKSYFANLLHVDKPYSKNMLKIIIPISVKNVANGPLAVKIKKPLKLNKNMQYSDFKNFTSNDSNTLIYAFSPSRCFHMARVPHQRNSCLQIMIQLNPSRFWSINKEIHKRQMSQEPKFTEIKCLFDKYEII